MKWFTGKEPYISAKQLLVELQETKCGIHDYSIDQGVFASVRMLDNAKYIDHFLYESYLATYMLKEIYKYTGIPFDAFLKQPRYRIDLLLKGVDAHRKIVSNAANDALKGVMNAGKE